MLTKEQLKVFDLHQGDEEHFADAASGEEQEIMSDQDFRIIHDLIENQFLVDTVRTSDAFKKKHEENLDQLLEDPELRKTIVSLSKKYVYPKRSVLKSLRSKIDRLFSK